MSFKLRPPALWKSNIPRFIAKKSPSSLQLVLSWWLIDKDWCYIHSLLLRCTGLDGLTQKNDITECSSRGLWRLTLSLKNLRGSLFWVDYIHSLLLRCTGLDGLNHRIHLTECSSGCFCSYTHIQKPEIYPILTPKKFSLKSKFTFFLTFMWINFLVQTL